MGILPGRYRFLAAEAAPRHLVEAVKLHGVVETPGLQHNPVIMAWADEVGIARNVYSSDEVPWCGLFMAVVMKRAQRDVVASPLWARSWASFGVSAEVAMLGDVLVFSRNGGGHVGIYVGEDKDCYHVLGGNQSNQVSVTRILKTRCIAIRRPPYRSQPTNVRAIQIAANGPVSTNEA